MDSSSKCDDVVSLGEALVEELGLARSVDTLGRWMSHHVAELIMAAKTAKPEEVEEAELRCRRAVIDLWNHLEIRFGNTERIEGLFETLTKLDPENQDFHYETEIRELLKQRCTSLPPKLLTAEHWLDEARLVDYGARTLIIHCLKEAAMIIGKEDEDFLELAQALSSETGIVGTYNVLVGQLSDFAETTESRRVQEIERQIQIAELLANSAKSLKERLENELATRAWSPEDGA